MGRHPVEQRGSAGARELPLALEELGVPWLGERELGEPHRQAGRGCRVLVPPPQVGDQVFRGKTHPIRRPLSPYAFDRLPTTTTRSPRPQAVGPVGPSSSDPW